MSGEKRKPYSYTYRVDLKSAQWCDGECLATRPFKQVSPALLVLEEKGEALGDGDYDENVIDRRDGSQKIISGRRLLGTPFLMKWEGQCTAAPFSGFPAPTTKF